MADPVLPADEVAEPTDRRAFEYVGETCWVDGVPFGHEMRTGDCYVSAGPLWDGDIDLLAEVESLRATVARLRTAAGDLLAAVTTRKVCWACSRLGDSPGGPHQADCTAVALRAALDDTTEEASDG